MRRPLLLRPTGLVAVVALLLCVALLSPTVLVASAASSSSVFAGPAGLLISSPLSLQGVDVGSTLRSLESRLTSLTNTVTEQTTRIAALEATVSQQAETIADQAETISSLSSLTGDTSLVQTVLSSNTSVTEIGDLTGPTIIVAVVKALRDLTGSSTIVTTVESLIDSMTDLATDIATLQTLEAETAQNLTTLEQTVTAQVTLVSNKIVAGDSILQAEIDALNFTLSADVSSLQSAYPSLSYVGVRLESSSSATAHYTTRLSWFAPSAYSTLTIPSNGTYLVFAQPRLWGVYEANGDRWWQWRVITGSATTLFTGLGYQSVGDGDGMTGNMYLGELPAGTKLTLQVYVEGTGGNVSLSCGADANGGSSFYAVRIA